MTSMTTGAGPTGPGGRGPRLPPRAEQPWWRWRGEPELTLRITISQLTVLPSRTAAKVTMQLRVATFK